MLPSAYCSGCGTHLGARVRCPIPWCPSHREAAQKRETREDLMRMLDAACDAVEVAIDDKDWDRARVLLEQIQTATNDGTLPRVFDYDRVHSLFARLSREWPDVDDKAVWWFGPKPWAAHICLHGKRVEIPVGMKCIMTGAIIGPDDRGFMLLHSSPHGTCRRPVLFEAMISNLGLG